MFVQSSALAIEKQGPKRACGNNGCYEGGTAWEWRPWMTLLFLCEVLQFSNLTQKHTEASFCLQTFRMQAYGSKVKAAFLIISSAVPNGLEASLGPPVCLGPKLGPGRSHQARCSWRAASRKKDASHEVQWPEDEGCSREETCKQEGSGPEEGPVEQEGEQDSKGQEGQMTCSRKGKNEKERRNFVVYHFELCCLSLGFWWILHTHAPRQVFFILFFYWTQVGISWYQGIALVFWCFLFFPSIFSETRVSKIVTTRLKNRSIASHYHCPGRVYRKSSKIDILGIGIDNPWKSLELDGIGFSEKHRRPIENIRKPSKAIENREEQNENWTGSIDTVARLLC